MSQLWDNQLVNPKADLLEVTGMLARNTRNRFTAAAWLINGCCDAEIDER